jgi:hypothetical protein
MEASVLEVNGNNLRSSGNNEEEKEPSEKPKLITTHHQKQENISWCKKMRDEIIENKTHH